MPFTVAKALEMEIFNKCRLLTGQAGLQNEIHWVNILEILDDLSHIEPGEFLITTAHGFKTQSESMQLNMIEIFASRKLAAMAIQTGHYLEEIPSSFIRFSEEHNIPLIQIPPEVSFKNLTRALMNALIHKEILIADKLGRGSIDGSLDSRINDMKDLWKRLIENENPEDLHLERGRHNVKSDGPTLVMALAIGQEDQENREQANEAKHELLRQAEQAAAHILSQQNVTFLIGPSEDFLPVLIQEEKLEGKSSTAEMQIAMHLQEQLKIFLPRCPIYIGLSTVHTNIVELKQCLDEAKKAGLAAQLELLDRSNIVSYRVMSLYSLIIDIKNIDTLKGIFYKTAAPLLDYDRRSKGPLIQTLKAYLQFLSIKKSSEALYVHRHTMSYRLQQIEELTGFNPLLPNDALQLNIGLHIYYYLKALKLLT